MTHLRRRSPVAIAALIVLCLAVPSSAVAAPESDIPGIALTGPTATGQLGGPIYDVVYRIAVQPGYVIVAGLTGTIGTDFDLYLFDSTATTVVSNVGLVAKSTGPTSTEHIAYPSAYGGTFYIDLNGATAVEGTYTLTVQVVKDTLVPTASLLLDGGRRLTNSTTVAVTLTASGSLSGISLMAFSGDGINFGQWQPYTAASTWTFPAGDGIKALWAKVRNGVGTESAVVSNTILLDTAPPTATVVLPDPNTTVAGLRPTFIIGFNKPIDPATWSNSGLVVQSATGDLVSGTYALDQGATRATFTPSADLTAGLPYVVTVGAVRDLAGNLVVPLGSWIVTPLVATGLQLSGGPSPVAVGAPVALAGSMSGGAAATIRLSVRSGDATTFTSVEDLPVVGGAVSATVPAVSNAVYRLEYPGSPTTAASMSNGVRIIVRRSVSLVGMSASTTRFSRAGTRITLVAAVSPVGGGARVSFQLYRYVAARGTYVYAGSYGRTTDSSGRALQAWTPAVGRYYWRVAVLPTPEYANNITPAYRWTVAGG